MRQDMNSASPVAAVQGMTVCFGRLTAVRDLSFTVERGSVYALLGRNGSGKSTTIRCLLGQLKPQYGKALLFGEDAWYERTRMMVRVGVVPESPDVPLDMTAQQAARFVAPFYPRWDDSGFSERLRRFEIQPNQRFSRLSKGQQKQVSLALALAMTPDFLVLDDPTLGLDAVARKILFDELIGDLADRGTTVLISTHDLAGIEGVADQVGVIDRGEMLVDEELAALKARFRRIRTPNDINNGLAEMLGQLGVVTTREVAGAQETVISAFTDSTEQELARLCGGSGVQIETMPLEEIFVTMCGDGNGGAS